jgi:hypothetical protein
MNSMQKLSGEVRALILLGMQLAAPLANVTGMLVEMRKSESTILLLPIN